MELCGTYRLISSSRRIVESGQEVDAFGKNAKGLIMYGEDGHFLALVTNDGRPKPESIGTMSDQQRADLHRSMTAYGGTFTFDGKKVEHHIDLSWNEVWTGTTVIRDVKIEGDRAIYTSRPAPYGGDGKMSVVTLVWEKVK
jgi:Lipocalin-like domain